MANVSNSRANGGAYRWTCPICRESGYVTKARSRSNAVDVLASHIRATVGMEHGPRHETPPGCDLLSLGEHVENYER